MIDDERPAAGVGHNSIDLRSGAVADLKEALERFEERKAQFLKSAANAKVKNRATAGDAADVIRLARDVWNLIEAERTTRSAPYRAAADALKGYADEFWWPVDEAMQKLRLDIDEWTAEEDARIEEQQREQNERMAALRKPVPQPLPGVVTNEPDCYPTDFKSTGYLEGATGYQAPRPRGPAPKPKRRDIRGDLGGKVISADVRTYTVTNARELPDWVLDSEPVKAALQTVLRQSGKHMTTIPGVEIGSSTTNRIG